VTKCGTWVRRSKQHFFNAHKSQIGIPILIFSATSASMRRFISNRNNNHLHTHTHIRSSTIRNLPRCNRTVQFPDKFLDTVHTNLLSSFWPSNQDRSVTSGKIEWANLPVSAESYFACHALINANLVKLWKAKKNISQTPSHNNLTTIFPHFSSLQFRLIISVLFL
jgi:hypothetical protein